MNTDDTGSWARPNPTDRTDPELIDIARLAPAPAPTENDADDADSAGAPQPPVAQRDDIEVGDDELVDIDVDDVDPSTVADDDIADIMEGFKQRADRVAPIEASVPAAEAAEAVDAVDPTSETAPSPDEATDEVRDDVRDEVTDGITVEVTDEAAGRGSGSATQTKDRDDADRNAEAPSSDTSNDSATADEVAPDEVAPAAVAPAKDDKSTTPEVAAPAGFAALGLRSELVQTLNDLGYEEPTPIQRETIPILLTGHDLLGQAATGTGKTAAFALPALNAIEPGFPDAPSVLVLTPTRELAVQVSEAIVQYGKKLGAKVVPVFGGQPIGRQLGALDRGAHVVVATPGRAIDHIGRGSLRLDQIKTVILDEADEMLDMGFTDDIESILESTPEDRQTVMFSATMPPRINSIAKRHQRNPHKIKIGKAETQESQKLIRQRVYFVKRNDKPYALGRILDIETPDAAIVFCRTRMDVDQLTATMGLRGYRAEALHGGMDQTQRDRVMARLRDGTAELLVATDVAARGLDVDTLTHVVNYDVPAAAESYVHRIGRVGRAGREGTAITLADPRDRRQLGNIERLMKTTIEVGKVPSVADLRARQVEVTVNQVREALTAVDLEDFNKVLHALAGEDSDRNIALAAIKLVHEARGAVMDEREIPDASVRNDRSEKWKDKRSDGKGRHRDDRAWDDKSKGKKKFDRDDRKGKKRDFDNSDTAFVFISLGRKAGVRPGDLVGAIANESGLTGRQIGPIRISEQHSVVGVPKDELDRVINAMDRATMRGKPVKARPYID